MIFKGERLTKLRKVMNWSLADVSAKTGLTASHIHEIETGKRNPRPATLKKLTESLGVEEQYFYLDNSSLPTSIIPNMPEDVKKFIVNDDNVPWLVLIAKAKRKGVNFEDLEKIVDILAPKKSPSIIFRNRYKQY